MVTGVPQNSSYSASSVQPVKAKLPQKNRYETSHFKSISFHVHETPDRKILSLQKKALENKPRKKTQPCFDASSSSIEPSPGGKRKYTQVPADSVKKPLLPINNTAAHRSPNEIHYSSNAPSPTSSENPPILTNSPPAVRPLGFNLSFARLKFDDIITIARQSLEFLAQMPGIVNLRPSCLNFEPDSRCLTVLTDNQNDNVQLFTSSFYQCPEALLEGPIDRLDDIWSLGCILFELWTNEPLFVTDLPLSPNILLHQMYYRIGKPTKQFLQKCRDSERYFILDPEVQFRQNLLIAPVLWKDCIQLAGLSKRIAQEKIDGFIQLLEQMLTYENKCPPHILLNNPIFQNDIRVYLPLDFTITDKITIYRNSEMEARLYYHSAQPLSAVHVDGSATQPYLHIPRDPSDQYIVFIERNGRKWIPECLSIKDGDRIAFLTLEVQTAATSPA
jgi:hypothetical protein